MLGNGLNIAILERHVSLKKMVATTRNAKLFPNSHMKTKRPSISLICARLVQVFEQNIWKSVCETIEDAAQKSQ